jgi:hypothetical protein
LHKQEESAGLKDLIVDVRAALKLALRNTVEGCRLD